MIYKIISYVAIVVVILYLLLPSTQNIESFTSNLCYTISTENKYLTLSSEENNNHVYLDKLYKNNPIYFLPNKKMISSKININLIQSQKFVVKYIQNYKNLNMFMIRSFDQPYLYLKAKCNNEVTCELIGGSSDQFWIIEPFEEGVSIESCKFPGRYLSKISNQGGYLFSENRGRIGLSSEEEEWMVMECAGKIKKNRRSMASFFQDKPIIEKKIVKASIKSKEKTIKKKNLLISEKSNFLRGMNILDLSLNK